ncbi:hypothetical protein [Mycobacterium malmoense]|uniref:hypothetical protein n=1 Tax=Mycobacterium malmoense TaxID=1780 RepID=UPI0008F8AFD2|nr:hypothetical protein [Mycobacterium malmoense]OIN78484.1 hypothetical protein BMG05_24525 [Mycobacterium malmoense]
MQQLTALQPLVTAGAAAVGASLIALTPGVSNNLAVDLQHSAATIEQRAVQLASTDYAVNPLQTWLDVFTTAAANLQAIGSDWAQIPAILAQQVAANWIEYATEYVSSYQTAANAAVDYYLGAGSGDFAGTITQALSAVQTGNIGDAVENLYDAFIGAPLVLVFQPLEAIPQILNPITQNLANATDYLTVAGVQTLGDGVVVGVIPQLFVGGIAQPLQNAYDAFSAGDPVDGMLNLLNLPGAEANAVLNGVSLGGWTNGGGLLSHGVANVDGPLNALVNYIPQHLAPDLVAPQATNITTGGSLATTWATFLSQLTGGWPSPNEIVDNILNVFRTYGGLPGVASAANAGTAADFATAASAVASLSANFASVTDLSSVAALSLLPTDIAASLPADVANVAGHLGADLASVLPGMILSILHF